MAKARKIVKPDVGFYNKADLTICKSKFNLEEEVQNKIRGVYKDYNDICQLMRDALGDVTLDENSPEFDYVRNFVVRLHAGKEAYNFTEDELKYLYDNAPVMTASDMCRSLFPDKEGAMTHEINTTKSLIRAWNREFKPEPGEKEVMDITYVPPNVHKLIAKINSVDPSARYHISTLDSRQRECLDNLKKNLSTPRFIAKASSYKRQSLRDLFEMEFIRATYDKPDNGPNDTNGYISLAAEYVRDILISENIALLNDTLHEDIGGDSSDARTFTKTLADALKSKSEEHDACQRRIEALHKSLEGTRKERIGQMNIANESLAKWVDMVREEDNRKKLLRIQEANQVLLGDELEKLDAHSYDSMIAEISGTSIKEILRF